jgi:hypothetical protein
MHRLSHLLPLFVFATFTALSQAQAPATPAGPITIRVATFNLEDVRTTDLKDGTQPRLRALAEVIQRLRPNLIMLNVQGCFGLNKIIFTKGDPLKALLPPGHRSPRFRVNAANANLGPAARSALNNNPCCAGIDEASGGVPRDMMASMFQQMHFNTASGNGGASEDEEDEDENDGEEEIQYAD